MKRFVLLFLFALASTLRAETPRSFADIPFGTPFDNAEAMMKGRAGIKAESNDVDRLTFTGGTFAGQPVMRWTLTFAAGKFASGSAYISKVKKPVYDEIKAQLSKKYGKPDSEEGHHSFQAFWAFRSDGHRTITLEYEYKGFVTVTYAHVTLLQEVAPGKKSDL